MLHHLSLLKGREDDSKLTLEEAKNEVEKSKKTSIKVVSFFLCVCVTYHIFLLLQHFQCTGSL